MVYKLGNIKDMDLLPDIDANTREVIYGYVKVLTDNYGAERNVDHNDGGYVLYVERGTSIDEIKAYFDFTKCQIEYVKVHRETEPVVCSALYILNNEFTVVIIT